VSNTLLGSTPSMLPGRRLAVRKHQSMSMGTQSKAIGRATIRATTNRPDLNPTHKRPAPPDPHRPGFLIVCPPPRFFPNLDFDTPGRAVSPREVLGFPQNTSSEPRGPMVNTLPKVRQNTAIQAYLSAENGENQPQARIVDHPSRVQFGPRCQLPAG